MSRAPSRLRRASGLARRTVLPVLALAAAAFAVVSLRTIVTLQVGWTSGDLAASVLGTLGFLLVLIALPIMLFAISGLRLRRWWRAGAAVLIAAYAAVMAPSAILAGLAASDALRHDPLPFGSPGAEWAAGWAILRAHPDPEAAARAALRRGDSRFYAVEGLVLKPIGIRWSPEAEERFAVKRMPGFSDMPESTPEAIRYYREVGCWVVRYDTVIAHRTGLPGVPRGQETSPRARACDAVRAAR